MRRVGIQLDFAGGYGRGVLRGVMQYANLQRDWEFVMPPMYSLKSKRTVDPRSADGVIAMVHSMRSVEPFRRARVPVVNAARTLSGNELRARQVPTILPDDVAVGRMAYAYFYERGFRSFAFCGHPTAHWSQLRLEGFAACCARDGLRCDASSAADHVSRKWIRALPRPCAILAANDRYAWHAIDVCREDRIAVPEEIAVLGVDNDGLLAEMISPTLSSIDLGADRIGFEAARVLDGLMKGDRPTATQVEFAPSGVITRHSTDVLSIEDDAVAESVRYIREHAAEPIGVDDVLGHVTMSRRNLERRFKRSMGRSLLEEIRRVRLGRACDLLRETDLDMARIARRAGFASQVRFSTVFREQFGQTPTEYRRAERAGGT